MATSNEPKSTESKRDFTVVGRVHHGGRLRTAGESVSLTDAQAARGIKRGDLAESNSAEAGKAREQSKGRAQHENNRDALDRIPFTGNTAGQPIADAPIPFQNTAETQVVPTGEDQPEKGVSENRAASNAGAPVASKTTGIKKSR